MDLRGRVSSEAVEAAVAVFDEFQKRSPRHGLRENEPDALLMRAALEAARRVHAPISVPMLLWCPECGERHIDEGAFATKPHHTHACQHCGHVWRPAVVPTVGVQFLPGFKSSK